MIVWIVGLSGSGKTTIGTLVWQKWRQTAPNTVLIDGDEIRQLFNADKSADNYTIEGRRKNADRIVALCQWLDRQQINVVCCILSIFEDMRIENRRRFSHYYEVFLQVGLDVVKQRDTKGLYRSACGAHVGSNVVGLDIPFVEPRTSDITINTDGSGDTADQAAQKILDGIAHVG